MTTDAIYEERGSDWSHQVSVVGTTRRLQRAKVMRTCYIELIQDPGDRMLQVLAGQ